MKQACGGRAFNHAVVPYTNGFAENYGDQRYLAVRLPRDEGDVYVAIYGCRNHSAGGPTRNLIYTRLVVVETKAMAEGKVLVNAEAMADRIAEEDHITLYGVYFDINMATIKPESSSTRLLDSGRVSVGIKKPNQVCFGIKLTAELR